jgi:glucose/mannose transport system permease protein
MAISFIVTGIVWQWLFHPSSGLNLLSRKAGYDGPVPAWSTDANVLLGFDLGKIEAGIPVALLPVVVTATWHLAGFTMERDADAATTAIQQACTENEMWA